MRLKTAALLVLIVILLLFSSFFVSHYWGSLRNKENLMALELQYFDKKIEQGDDACFSLFINSNLERKTITDYSIRNGNNIIKQEKIDVGFSKLVEECIPTESLSLGENLVEIQIRNILVFFHVKVENKVQKTEPIINLEVVEKEKLKIEVLNNPDNAFQPIKIFVNDKLDHTIYFSEKSFSSIEKLELENGSNEVKVKFANTEQSVLIEKKAEFKMNPLFGFLLISLLLCSFFVLVFPTKPFLERIALSILSFFATIILLFFTLDVLGVLSLLAFVLTVSAATVFLILFFKKNLEKSVELPKDFSLKNFFQKISPIVVLLVIVLVFTSMVFHFITPTYYSIFTSFYERQSQHIAEIQAIPSIDPFSFLGTKPFGYISAYFFINAGISWIGGISTMQSFAVIALLSQAAFLCIAVLFFRALKIPEKNCYLGVMLLLLGVFVFSDLLFNIRHVVANSFMLASLVFLKRKQPLISGGLLAVGAFVQPPIFLMFAAISLVVVEWRKEAKNFFKGILIGAIGLIALFIPTFLRSGLPTQAKPEVWGYLWSIPLYGFVLDFLSAFVFIGVFIIPLLLLKKIKLDGFAIKTIIILVLFMLVQLFVSYRINVVNSIVLAVLLAYLFPKNFLENRFSALTMASLFSVVFLAMAILSSAFYPLHPIGVQAFTFVKENTSTNANFLVEPYLGHPFILVAQRKATADLAVEYANEEMINESYRFLKEKDNSILEKYDIDFVVNRSIFLDEKPIGDNLYQEVMEFTDLDKIYANEIFFIHSVRKK